MKLSGKKFTISKGEGTPRAPYLTRRDFLKLGAVGAAATALSQVPGLTNSGEVYEGQPREEILPTPGQIAAIIKADKDNSKQMGLAAAVLLMPKISWKAKFAASAALATTSCTPRPDLPPNVTKPTLEQEDNVIMQATALPPELNPTLVAPTPPALEAIPSSEPNPGNPSVVGGLNIGEVTPNNLIGMVPGYETTGINTLYNPKDPKQQIETKNGPIEAIPPTAYGIDQGQIKKMFGLPIDAPDGSIGSYNGAAVTLTNGIWTSETGDVFVPFCKVYEKQKAAIVMDVNGDLQKVNVVDGSKIGEAYSMFQTPKDTATRMIQEVALNDPENTSYANINPDNVVGVEMNKNGSISFITKEARSSEKDPKKTVRIVKEVTYLGEKEDLSKTAAAEAAATAFVGAFAVGGLTIDKELLKKNFTVMRVEGLDPTDPKKQKKKNYDIATVNIDDPIEGRDYPMMIKGEEGQWSVATNKTLAGLANLDWGSSTTISYAQDWSPESKVIIPILTKHGNRFVIDYDMMWYNPDYPENSVRPGEEDFNYKQLNLAIKFAKENKLSLQGQTLLVSIPRFLPPWLTKKTDSAEILEIAKLHISTMIKKYPQIDTWCVAAELENPYAQNFWTKTFGLNDLSWLKQSFEEAKLANPEAKLYYSDFDIEFGGDKADKVFKIMNELKQAGTPIDAVAFQMHLNGKEFIDPQIRAKKIDALKLEIARYREIGIEIILPEFDLSMQGAGGTVESRTQLQSDIEYDIMAALLESGITNINHFGGNDKLNWKQETVNGGGKDALATNFDSNGKIKMNYFADMRAIMERLQSIDQGN